MRSNFDKELDLLNNKLIKMGSLVEERIESAIKALANRDMNLANHIIQGDVEVDYMEREIESECLKLLLQQQPVAGDLRLISTILKMITDLERIGDHAQDISEITLLFAKGKLKENMINEKYMF